MGESCLAEYLGQFADIDDAERAALSALTTGGRHYRRGSVVRPEHGPVGDMFVVQSGWLYSCALLEDGRRQIVRLHFQGDLLGLDGLAFDESTYAIRALTDAEICTIDRDRFARLFAEHPRLGALLLAMQQVDQHTFVDRLISLGRNSARGRIAGLLLWIAGRLEMAGVETDEGFALPLTQEEIGDLTGLTAVHVNRTMRVLVEGQLIARAGGHIRILDADKLGRIANHVVRRVRVDRGWLPERVA